MRRRYLPGLCALLLLSSAAGVAAAQPGPAANPATVKVLQLAALCGGASPALCEALDEALLVELRTFPRVSIVSPTEAIALPAAAGEPGLLLCADPGCLHRVAEVFAADIVIGGRVDVVGDRRVISYTRVTRGAGRRPLHWDAPPAAVSAEQIIEQAPKIARALLPEFAALEILRSRPPHAGRDFGVWPWVTLGAAIAAAGTGATFGVMTIGTRNDRDQIAQTQGRDSAAYVDRSDTLSGQARIANLSFVATAIFAGTTLVLWLLEGSEPAPREGTISAP